MSDVNVRNLPSHKIEPKYNGYQLIGDDQFLRFSECLLSIKCTKLNGFKFSGLCVRDQKIIDLLRRIHIGFGDISEKVVLMIGTNDLLCGTSFEAMCEDFKELLRLLSKVAQKIILLTVPPVPKLEKNEDHWNRLKKFNEFIKQCRDDEKIFVGDAYAQFVVSKELPNKKSCPSNSNVANYNSCPKSTPIRFSKWLFTSVANGDKTCHRVMPSPSPSNFGKLSPPVKRFRPALSSLPLDQEVIAMPKVIHRRPFFDPKNCFRKDGQSPAAERYCYPPTKRSFSTRVFEHFFRSLQKSSSGSDDSFTASSSKALTFERECDSPFVLSTPSSGGDDSFLIPSKRACMLEKKYNPPYFPLSFSPGGNLFLSNRQLALHRKREFYSSLTTPSSSSDDSFRTSSRRMARNEKFTSYSNPNPRSIFFGGVHSLETPSRKAAIPERKCYSPFFLTKFSSGDDDSRVTPSKRLLILEERRDSNSVTDDNHIDSYDRESIEDEVNMDNADKIRDECFEMYFSGDCKRPDLIHLNIRGLCALRGIIQGIIDIIDDNYS